MLAEGHLDPHRAFQDKDGSWNLKFDLLPAQPNTTIQMHEPRERDDAEAL